MNATMTSKSTMRMIVTILALTMFPALAWAQFKIYIPPKIYTPPKVSVHASAIAQMPTSGFLSPL